jgi:hypothetical protein
MARQPEVPNLIAAVMREPQLVAFSAEWVSWPPSHHSPGLYEMKNAGRSYATVDKLETKPYE